MVKPSWKDLYTADSPGTRQRSLGKEIEWLAVKGLE